MHEVIYRFATRKDEMPIEPIRIRGARVPEPGESIWFDGIYYEVGQIAHLLQIKSPNPADVIDTYEVYLSRPTPI